MKTTLKALAPAAAALLMLGSASAAFAKAHDQGVADGQPTPDNTGAFVQSLGGMGVSTVTSKGARGAGASAAQSGNAVDPVVGNGANSSN